MVPIANPWASAIPTSPVPLLAKSAVMTEPAPMKISAKAPIASARADFHNGSCEVDIL